MHLPGWTILSWALWSLLPRPAHAEDQVITYPTPQGGQLYLADYRQPALYTQEFGSCLAAEQTSISITRFDAALYMDNMTVSFHIGGLAQTALDQVTVVLSVWAYGSSRFELPFSPCGNTMVSLCPVRASVPVLAEGIIPLSSADVADIPSLAFAIPDFEGQAVLRFFSNTSHTEIGCYAAALTNGVTLQQKPYVGGVLAAFTLVAVLASAATAVYGGGAGGEQLLQTVRVHHAHSLSVLVVFAVFHHIYLTGALAVNWPRILVSFWSNYGWAAGMIYVPSMQQSLNTFMGSHLGNTLHGGAAQANSNASDVAGGFDPGRLYPPSQTSINTQAVATSAPPLVTSLPSRRGYQAQMGHVINARSLQRRGLIDRATGFGWYGDIVDPNMPLPGNYSGFAGTLSADKIAATNAMLTGLIWFILLLDVVGVGFAVFRHVVLPLILRKHPAGSPRETRFKFFKVHWKRHAGFALLKACYIAFPVGIFLTVYQFSYGGSVGALALAVIVFVVFLTGVGGACGYACYERLKWSTWQSGPNRIYIERTRLFKALPLPWLRFHSGYRLGAEHDKNVVGSFPGWMVVRLARADEVPANEDLGYMQRFGWLSGRFRNTQWHFFGVWLCIEFVRSCILGGASGSGLVQIILLLTWDSIAFVVLIKSKPYEGQRLNVLLVYLLSISKMATTGLSLAFLPRFQLGRVLATGVGIFIGIIHAILTLAVVVCIMLGALTSYFSLTRNRSMISPRNWLKMRGKYFAYIGERAVDPKPIGEDEKVAKPVRPYFRVHSIKRYPKIEDEDIYFRREIMRDPRHVPNSKSEMPPRIMLHRGHWTYRDAGPERSASTEGSGMNMTEVEVNGASALSDKDVAMGELDSPLEYKNPEKRPKMTAGDGDAA